MARWKFLVLVLVLIISGRETTAQEKGGDKHPNAIQQAQKSLELPQPPDRVVVGGSGRFLICHFASLNRLIVIDVKSATIVKQLDFTEKEGIAFAAGAERLFVLLRGSWMMVAYDYLKFNREVLAKLPDEYTIVPHMIMGHASRGPIYMSGRWPPLFFDPQSKEFFRSTAPDYINVDTRIDASTRAAANGTLFAHEHGPTLLVNGRDMEYFRASEGDLPVPSADGLRLYCGHYLHGPRMQRLHEEQLPRPSVCIPAVTGDLYLRMACGALDVVPAELSLYARGISRPLMTLPEKAVWRPILPKNRSRGLAPDERVFYFPEYSLLVLMNAEETRFNFVPIDFDRELGKLDFDYLFILSQAPTIARAGELLTYRVVAKSNSNKLSYRILNPREKMSIDEKGNFSWQVPAAAIGFMETTVAVTSGAGQEALHTIRVAVGDRSKEHGPDEAIQQFKPQGPPLPIELDPPPVFPAKIEGKEVKVRLPAHADWVETGGGGRYIIIHFKSSRQLGVFDLCEVKWVGFVDVDDDRVRFAAGRRKLIAVLDKKDIVLRWDLRTLRLEAAAPCPGDIARIAMGHASEGPIIVLRAEAPANYPESKKSQIWDKQNGKLRYGALGILDAATLLERKLPETKPHLIYTPDVHSLRASADGQSFSLGYNSRFETWKITDTKLAPVRTIDSNNFYSTVPDTRGLMFYSGPRRFPLYSGSTPRIQPHQDLAYVPAASDPYYLAVSFQHDHAIAASTAADKFPLIIHVEGDSHPLLVLEGFPALQPNDVRKLSLIPVDKRVFYVPDAKVIATLDPSLDLLTLRKLDLIAELEANGLDYLFVESSPFVKARPGDEIKYQVRARSKNGGVEFRLLSGPAGLTISRDGLITWKTGANSSVEEVKIAVTDASRQEFTYSLQVIVWNEAKQQP